jgi:hypothetical protein
MKKNLLALSLMLFCFVSFAQENLLLSNFKYRINLFRAFNFTGGAGSNFVEENKLQDYHSFRNNFNVNGSYNTLHSTDKVLFTASYFLGANLAGNGSNDRDVKLRGLTYGIRPEVRINQKWFNNKLRFIELGTSIQLSDFYGRQKQKPDSIISKNTAQNFSIAINTGIGFGRLENITDMQNALWLKRALDEDGFLTKSLTPEELNQLGRTITRANNTRVLDFRKRIQFILETTDSFFQQQQVIKKPDIRYFSHLNDIVFFAFNNQRFSGTEKFIRFTPAIVGSREKRNWVNNSTKEKFFDTKSLELSIGINHYSPKSLTRQINYGTAIKYNTYYSDIINRETPSGTPIIEDRISNRLTAAVLTAFYEYALYPNTRTNINFNLTTMAGTQRAKNVSEFLASANLNTNISYFISFNTRFNFSMGCIFQHNEYVNIPELIKNPNRLQLFANASIDISF